ncbi:hypothetical protein HYX13_01920 [Candidatus Woesearchaeota archaeon]|nr:hypothetical protein [Candidatus Woesearchaeota archaeon]
MSIPSSLRTWFLIHFSVDYFFGIPLLFFPQWTLLFFGFGTIENFTVRLVGAALLAIGGISLLARNETKEVYVVLLRLKLLWSGSAIVAIMLSLFQGAQKNLWLFLSIFIFFFFLWGYYLRKLVKK